MKKKPFYRWPIYIIERSKYNPMRYILGEKYLSSNIKKWFKQFDLDTTDIKITKIDE